MDLGPDAALWVAVAAPVLVIGWSMAFAAKSAISGPAWALGHLRIATPSLLAGVVAGVAATTLVTPVWMGLSVLYPFAVGTWMAAARRRQLAFVERDGGFGEIDPHVRYRVSRGLGRGLHIAGALAWFTGLLVVLLGVAQGWLIALLGPVAVLIALVVGRRTVLPGV